MRKSKQLINGLLIIYFKNDIVLLLSKVKGKDL